MWCTWCRLQTTWRMSLPKTYKQWWRKKSFLQWIWIELKGLGMDPSSIGRAECPLSQRELPTPPPIASRSSSPANKGHFQLLSFSFLSDDYRAAALFTTSNYVGNTKLWAPEKLVGGEEVAIEYGEAEDVCKVFLSFLFFNCISVCICVFSPCCRSFNRNCMLAFQWGLLPGKQDLELMVANNESVRQ